MSLGLHQKCLERLMQVVVERLPGIKVKNRMFLDRRTAVMLLMAESTLPQSGVLHQNLQQYIGEMPFADFAIELLSQNLLREQKYDSGVEAVSLSEVQGYEDLNGVARYLVNEFESLPWKYSLSIELGNDFGELFAKALGSLEICDSAKVIAPNDEYAKLFPLKSGIEALDRSLGGGLLNLFSKPEWNANSAYLQIVANGFIGPYTETKPLEEAISLLKAFCGAAIALRLLKVEYSYRSFPAKSRFYVHRQIDDNWRIERVHELDTSVSDTLHDLVLHDLDGKLRSDDQKARWMEERLKEIGSLFGNRQRAQKILLGSQWLFDSYCGKNELLSFVQTVVVMEILLGEKTISDLLGLGELLRNRCAYLIGDSHKQREEVLADFREIYDLRSKIVHRGKVKLNLTEKSLFTKLQWMCRRVIQEEVRMLQQDIKDAASANVLMPPTRNSV
jgi:hypothetical protein